MDMACLYHVHNGAGYCLLERGWFIHMLEGPGHLQNDQVIRCLNTENIRYFSVIELFDIRSYNCDPWL